MGPRDAVTMARIEAAQQQYQVQKDKYERLRSDVTIKLKFLEENKVFISHLLLFQCLCNVQSIAMVDVHLKQLTFHFNRVSFWHAVIAY